MKLQQAVEVFDKCDGDLDHYDECFGCPLFKPSSQVEGFNLCELLVAVMNDLQEGLVLPDGLVAS